MNSSPTAILYRVLTNVFWSEPLGFESLSKEEFAPIMRLARRQTVEGLVAGAFMRNHVGLNSYNAAYVFSRSSGVSAMNKKLDSAVIALSTLLNGAGVRHVIFKGQTISSLYPYQNERQPGDIDFYCYEKDLSKAVRLIEQTWKVVVEKGESELHYSFTHEGIPYEMHFNMLFFSSASNQRYWDSLLEKDAGATTLVANKPVPVLSPTLNVLYTFLHLYGHLLELGVGLRHFCDVMCLLHHYNGEIDRELLQHHLEVLGYKRAFCSIGWILINRLGLPKNEFPVEISEKDKRKERQILSVVYHGGNFGKYMSKTRVRSGMRYNVEAAGRKLKHYFLFWSLSPKEITAGFFKKLPKKMFLGLFNKY